MAFGKSRDNEQSSLMGSYATKSIASPCFLFLAKRKSLKFAPIVFPDTNSGGNLPGHMVPGTLLCLYTKNGR